MVSICRNCGAEFSQPGYRTLRQKFCSPACRRGYRPPGRSCSAVKVVSDRPRSASKIGRVPSGTVESLLREQERKCSYCGAEIPPFHLEHKLPVARGGKNTRENLHLTCPRCNLRKGSLAHDEFLVSKRRRVMRRNA